MLLRRIPSTTEALHMKYMKTEDAKYYLMSEYFYAEDAVESLKAFADEIGINIIDYSIDWSNSSHSYVRWEGTPSTQFIKEDLTGYCMDFELTRTFNKTRDVDECINEWLHACWADYAGQFDDDYVKEHCEANGYEFTETGDLI